MDYVTPDGSKIKLTPPHDFTGGESIARDLMPNIDGILNHVHSVGADGSYVMRDGNWQYQPPMNSFLFHDMSQNANAAAGAQSTGGGQQRMSGLMSMLGNGGGNQMSNGQPQMMPNGNPTQWTRMA